MTSRNASGDDFDRLMRQWLDAEARVGEREHLLDQVLTQTRVARRLPRWVLPEWWLPMQLTMPLRSVPRIAPLLLLIALLLAAALAVVWVGTRPRPPDPFGPAANGRVAYLSNGQIYAANADGSDPIALTSGSRSAATPAWSRDGTKFAYKLVSPRPGTDHPTLFGDLVVADADGTNLITIDREAKDPSPPVWSPDGQLLVYSKDVDIGTQIFVAAADGSSPPARIGNPETVNWAPIFSPDGTKIMYFEGYAGNGLGVMNTDGSDVQIVNQTRFDQVDSATWHPDGKRIDIAATVGGESDLWILHVDGLPEQHLKVPGRAEVGPSWSPAGDRLAYLASGDGLSFRLLVADAQGANERSLPGTYSHINPSWSPDGTRIAVLTEFATAVRLTLVDPDGKADPIVIEGDVPDASIAAIRTSPTAWQRIAP